MRCTLLVPRLFWPRASVDSVLSGVELPALTLLLARARRHALEAASAEEWLCRSCGIERQRDWPIAPLTLELDGGTAGDACWLRADPVHVKVERNRLVLIESALLEPKMEEAQALVASLNAHFAADGMLFEAPVPERWYLRLSRVPDLVTQPPGAVAGEDVQANLPQGADALHWHGVLNEAQMLLHPHAVNAAREERGAPPINSLWLWGGGTRPHVSAKPFDIAWSNDAAVSAIVAAAGARAAPLRGDFDTSFRDAGAGVSQALIALDQLAAPAAYRDAIAWRERLAALDTAWFGPVVDALRSGRVQSVALVVPGSAAASRFDIARGDLFRFWRARKPLSVYA